MEEEWNELDNDIEELAKRIQDEEIGYEVAGEGETEVSKFTKSREDLKDKLVGELQEEVEATLHDRNNPRGARSLMLNLIEQSTKEDIKTLESIDSQYSGAEDNFEDLHEILDRLRNLESNTKELIVEYHKNDLAPIISEENRNETSQPENTSNSFKQDSSHEHQTDFSSFDPFED